MQINLIRRAISEGLGTAFLLAAIIGSGIMGERLADGNTAVALLANTIAIGAALVCLISTFAPISGAHFNPVVTLSDVFQGRLIWRDAFVYITSQIIGAFAGVAIANIMFGLPVFFASTKVRTGGAQWLGEFVATFGLLMVIQAGTKFRPATIPFIVAAYILAAAWFTSSTSFANPAVTLARSASDTFTGISPTEVPAFIIAQLLGALAATILFRWLLEEKAEM